MLTEKACQHGQHICHVKVMILNEADREGMST